MNGIVSYFATNAGPLTATFIGAFLAVTVGSWLKAFATTKGKDAAATKEDIKEVLDKVSRVTDTTKSIESRISGDLWEKQSRWQRKEKFYVDAVVLTELAIRSALNIQKLLTNVPYLEKDQLAFQEHLDASIGEFDERRLELDLMMKKGRLFTDPSIRAAWNDMLAEWSKMASPRLDPWDALVQAGKGSFYNFKLRMEEEKTGTEVLLRTLGKLQDDIYEIAERDLHMN